MSFEVTLTYDDEHGRPRVVAVNTRYFSIGRNPDNNLSIPNSNLSRRHAMLESFDDFVQITDSGSQNGTTVNGIPVAGAVELRPGDVISLGGACSLVVGVRAATTSAAAPSPASVSPIGPPPPSAPTLNAAPSEPGLFGAVNQTARPWWMGAPLLAIIGASSFVVLVVIVLLLIFSGGSSDSKRQRGRDAARDNDNETRIVEERATTTNTSEVEPISSGQTVTEQTATPTVGVANRTDLDKIEDAAVAVMHRVSTDPKDYTFPEKALRDIAQKIESYRASSAAVRDAINSLQRGGPALAAKARNEGISQPYLLGYAALAGADGGRGGRDALATAQAMMPDLIALLVLFGDDADSSLLVIAAFPEGPGSKKSHPLLARLPRITDKPSQRNVWYATERRAIKDDAYDLVIRFLALGVIAQNPKQYGVPAEPLAF